MIQLGPARKNIVHNLLSRAANVPRVQHLLVEDCLTLYVYALCFERPVEVCVVDSADASGSTAVNEDDVAFRPSGRNHFLI